MPNLYSNIKKLRKQNNMSQQELAEAVGYKGKSMIAQVENGLVDLPTSMISKFAEVFQVSEVDLMEGTAVTEPGTAYILHSPDQEKRNEFIDLFESVPADVQETVLRFLKSAKPDS